jgi:hypothetical protein
MFSGQLPHIHGIHTHHRRFDSLPVDETFLADLPDSYTTIGVSANVHAGPAFGFDSLFDYFTSVSPHNRFSDGLDLKSFLNECDETGLNLYWEWSEAAINHEHPVKSLANGLLTKFNSVAGDLPIPRPIDDGTKKAISESRQYIEHEIDEPFFLFINLMEAHPPLQHTRGYDTETHDVPNSWSSKEFDYWEIRRDGAFSENEQNINNFKELYAAAIDYLDGLVQEFVTNSISLTDLDTTCIVTADHGEDLGDTPSDPCFGHIGSLSEGLLHVPFHLYNPPDGYPETVHKYTSLLNLGDLVIGLSQNKVVDTTRDSIPAELIGSLRQSQEWPLSESEFEYWNRMIRCAYRGNTKVEWDSLGNKIEHSLNRNRPSYQERQRELNEIPEWAKRFFKEEVDAYKSKAIKKEGSLDELVTDATMDRLEDLGYL